MAGKWWEMGDLLWEIGQNLVDFFWHCFTRGKETFMIEFQGAKNSDVLVFGEGSPVTRLGNFNDQFLDNENLHG